MKKWLAIVSCTLFAVSSLFLVSCEKKETATSETGGYGEKAEDAGGYGGGEKAEDAGGYGGAEKAEDAGGYGGAEKAEDAGGYGGH
jgi:hypothetical protein